MTRARTPSAIAARELDQLRHPGAAEHRRLEPLERHDARSSRRGLGPLRYHAVAARSASPGCALPLALAPIPCRQPLDVVAIAERRVGWRFDDLHAFAIDDSLHGALARPRGTTAHTSHRSCVTITSGSSAPSRSGSSSVVDAQVRRFTERAAESIARASSPVSKRGPRRASGATRTPSGCRFMRGADQVVARAERADDLRRRSAGARRSAEPRLSRTRSRSARPRRPSSSRTRR